MAQQESCLKCGGRGRLKCPECNGKGKVPDIEYHWNVPAKIKSNCPECGGNGTIDCPRCKGTGIKTS